MRRRPPDPLIDQIDDRGFRPLRHLIGEMLRQQQRRTQIDCNDLIEQCDVNRIRRIALEDRGIVDEDGQRAERRRCSLDNARRLLRIGEFGGDDDDLPALRPQMRRGRLGLRPGRFAAMDGKVIAGPGEALGNRAPDPPGGARHQSGLARHSLLPSIFREAFYAVLWRREMRPRRNFSGHLWKNSAESARG